MSSTAQESLPVAMELPQPKANTGPHIGLRGTQASDRAPTTASADMDCSCGSEQRQKKRAVKLRRKYENLRRHHKKLLGVAVELTQVLEEYVRGQRSPNVTETLLLCSNIYPSLFHELSARTKNLALDEPEPEPASSQPHKRRQSKLSLDGPEPVSPQGKVKSRRKGQEEGAADDVMSSGRNASQTLGNEQSQTRNEDKKSLEAGPGREYVEGFWSKRELPRTPLNRMDSLSNL